MKDGSFWIVVEDGKALTSGIRCDLGKVQAKELRKEKEEQTGRKWKALKTTKKELATAA
jgi:hypothetical protein